MCPVQAYEAGEIALNLDNPARKDSMLFAVGEFTVVRFTANNPGYWLFHCIMSPHMVNGMSVVVKQGDDGDWPVPKDFPRC